MLDNQTNMKRRTFIKGVGLGFLSILAFIYGIPQDTLGKSYPFEFMGGTYLLPRKLGANDSMVYDGFFFAQFEGTDTCPPGRVMLPQDAIVLKLA